MNLIEAFFAVERAVLFNEDSEFVHLSSFSPRTDGGILILCCNGFVMFVTVMELEGSLLTIPGIVVGSVPAIGLLIGAVAVLYPPL